MMQNDFYWSIVNAMPMPVFVMDEHTQVRDVNKAGKDFFQLEGGSILRQRTGEKLGCVNSTAGCGNAPACKNCVIRQSVAACYAGEEVSRRRMKFKREAKGSINELEFLITAAPLAVNEEKLVLVLIEDITQFSTLKTLLPMCMHCKKIRDDQQYWHLVENYFRSYIGLDFSHGVCPDCIKKLYAAELPSQ